MTKKYITINGVGGQYHHVMDSSAHGIAVFTSSQQGVTQQVAELMNRAYIDGMREGIIECRKAVMKVKVEL